MACGPRIRYRQEWLRRILSVRTVVAAFMIMAAACLVHSAVARGGDLASESEITVGAFWERLDREAGKAAADLIRALREYDPGLFADASMPVDIGVFPVTFSDGGVLELGRVAGTRMAAALGSLSGVSVMGEKAFLNVQYAVKGSFTAPVQGVVEFTWILESRQGDMYLDYKHIHTETFRLRLPGDAQSRRNLLLYVQRPEGMSDLPELDVPLLDIDITVTALRRERGEQKELDLPDGGWLGADDQFRICLKPNTDCYGYVFLRDSAGELYSLFPSPGIGLSNRLEGGLAHWVPEPTRESGVRWFYLDDNPGTEVLYVVADYEPIRNTDELLARISGGSAGEVEKELESWAVANRDASHARFRVFDGTGLRSLDEDFSLVRKFTIEHR